MIAKIARRGQSFKGMASYVMHDKGASTSERVGWSETGNLRTDDIEKAAAIMAWTDMNREGLRALYREDHPDEKTSAAGRKASAGNVYHYTLSWAIPEAPDEAHQRSAAHETLARLGLEEHQYFIVSHEDTAHKHVHVVANLVHPGTGLIKDPGLDKRAIQAWALEYEREHGLHCHQREENAQKRARGEPVRYRAEKQHYATQITQAWKASDNGQAFRAALDQQGLTLCAARRGGGFVVVDEKGDIQKLARQLQIEEKHKAKTAAINAKLSDLDRAALPDADGLAKELRTRHEAALAEKAREEARIAGNEHGEREGQGAPSPAPAKKPHYSAKDVAKALREKEQEQTEVWDRDAYEAESLRRIEEAAVAMAMEEDRAAREAAKAARQKAWGLEQREKKDPHWHLRKIEQDQARARRADFFDAKRREKIEEIKAYYKLDERIADYREASREAQKCKGFFAWLTGKTQAAQEHEQAMRLNMEDAAYKQQEAIAAINKKYHHRPSPKRQEDIQAYADRRAVSGQDKETIEQVESAREKDEAVLKEAVSAPEAAARAQHSVSGKTHTQRATVAKVKEKAREHEGRLAAAKQQAVKEEQETRERATQEKVTSRDQEYTRAAGLRAKQHQGSNEGIQQEYRAAWQQANVDVRTHHSGQAETRQQESEGLEKTPDAAPETPAPSWASRQWNPGQAEERETGWAERQWEPPVRTLEDWAEQHYDPTREQDTDRDIDGPDIER